MNEGIVFFPFYFHSSSYDSYLKVTLAFPFFMLSSTLFVLSNLKRKKEAK